jgi:hypothetical protein
LISPIFLLFLADKKPKNFVFKNNREICFVNNKNQPDWLKEIFIKKESVNKTNKANKRMNRFFDFMEKILEMTLQIMDSLDFPLKKIYKFRVMPASI